MKILAILTFILTLSSSAFAIDLIDENVDPTVNDARREQEHTLKSRAEIICEKGDGCVTQKNKAKEDAAKGYISQKKSKQKKSSNRQIKNN